MTWVKTGPLRAPASQPSAWAAALLALAVSVGAQKPPAAEPPVLTRAEVRSIGEEGAGRLYVRLKIAPRAKLPFSTLTFRVRDPALLQGIAVGDSVGFAGAQVEGENTLTHLRAAAPCQRFQNCPPP